MVAAHPSRIALFLPDLRGGGAQRVMLTLAKVFAERGCNVELVVSCARGPLEADIPDGVRLVDLGARRIITSLPALIRYFRRSKPPTMLSALSTANCLAVWARSLSGARTRLILTEHAHLSVAADNTLKRRGSMLPALMRQSYPKADGIVAVSRGVAEDLSASIGLTRSRIEVIYNPVISGRVTTLSRKPVDDPWFRVGQPAVILSVGRLIPQKDYPTLLKAFAELRAERPARLVILGDGRDRQELSRLANKLGILDDFALKGFVPNPYAYMRAASVFVLSSRWEGLPTVLIEALGCGVPVVSTDCPSGPDEILEGGKWGALVPVGEPAELARAIAGRLEADPSAGRAERIQRAQTFSDTAAGDAYLDLLRRSSPLSNGGAFTGDDRDIP